MMPVEAPDRSGLIRAFAIVLIIVGALIGMGALSSIAMIIAVPRGGEGSAKAAWVFIATFLVYAVPAANLLVTGIGSLRFQPWARRATLISAAIWMAPAALMLVGVVAALIFESMRSGFGEIMLIFILLPFIIGLPLTLLIVYTRAGVRETFARHAAARAARRHLLSSDP